MKKWIFEIIIFIILFFSTSWILDSYDESISEFNAKLTNFLRGNDFALRTFDKNGIPISNFGRLGIKRISPFYVVHYGLIYSKNIPHDSKYNYLWQYNNSIQYWNVPPEKNLITQKNFYYAANWIISHMQKDSKGKYHLLYKFDWHYKSLKNGILKSPWYSGLTDGMALTLLTKAYILSSDKKYKEAAYKLYKSVTSKIKNGGSTITLTNNNIWIEEYVVNTLPDNKQPRVLNGMIYSTFGVYFFERTFTVEEKKYKLYLKSIRKNIHKFDLKYWTAYDLIGTVANYKYHHIHLGLLEDLYTLTNDKYYQELSKKWKKYNTSFIKRHFFYNRPTVNSLMGFLEYIFILFLFELFIFKIFKKIKK